MPPLDGLDNGEAAVVELLLGLPPGRIQLLDGGTRSTAEGLFAPEGRDHGDHPVKFIPNRLAGGVDRGGGNADGGAPFTRALVPHQHFDLPDVSPPSSSAGRIRRRR